jgi:hypothetical protein
LLDGEKQKMANQIISEKSAVRLGIVSESGDMLTHGATAADVAREAIASFSSISSAQDAAAEMESGVYVIDEDGESHYFG